MLRPQTATTLSLEAVTKWLPDGAQAADQMMRLCCSDLPLSPEWETNANGSEVTQNRQSNTMVQGAKRFVAKQVEYHEDVCLWKFGKY